MDKTIFRMAQRHTLHLTILLVAVTLSSLPIQAQERLKSMPGYDQFQKMSREIPGSVKPGTVAVRWVDGGKSFEYSRDGRIVRYDLATRTTSPAEGSGPITGSTGPGRRGGPARGRQFDSATSPDGRKKVFYRQRNLWLSNADGSEEIAITSDGNEKTRIKYGSASWVYGEELNQNSAMWWSPDNTKVAFYRFDESPVTDFILQMDQTKLVSTADVEAYPKAGAPNPVATSLSMICRPSGRRRSMSAMASPSRTTWLVTTSMASAGRHRAVAERLSCSPTAPIGVRTSWS